MDSTYLQQFRQQLAAWIERQMVKQRLPFQRLEICPRILTEQGRLTPDLVLWINRDSQLTGSMILLPVAVNDQVITEASLTAQALGLGHFTIWAAQDVTIWKTSHNGVEVIHRYALPPASRIQPEDFEWTLEQLLEQLKIITITCSQPSAEFSNYYYANLCLRNLQELAPGLTSSARLTAGHAGADEWVKLAPVEKAWLSLWRILFLLWQKRLPPGLQPEKLEQAIHYALADFPVGKESIDKLKIMTDEPPLAEPDAIRLHHLAGRLSQLNWPKDIEQAVTLIELLLSEVAHRYGLTQPELPWSTGGRTLWVNTQPKGTKHCSLIAPRAYLCGWALKSLLKTDTDLVLEENLQAIPVNRQFADTVAVLNETAPADRNEREERLLLLRKAWPNRRFELSNRAPVWLWNALYLAGAATENLTLVLPESWHMASGVKVFWSALLERYHITDIFSDSEKRHILRLSQTATSSATVKIHRKDSFMEFSRENLPMQPGSVNFWLTADLEVIKFIREHNLLQADELWSDTAQWGAYLFLQTSLGRYLWDLCSHQAEQPDPADISKSVAAYGIPFPDELSLSDLGLAGKYERGKLPEAETLERELAGIYGDLPILPDQAVRATSKQPKARRRHKTSTQEIINKVFLDGIPRFPEHYLMDIYRPAMEQHQLQGPLEFAEEFFDRISLRTLDGKQTMEVSGKTLADALIFASWSGENYVELPKDRTTLEHILFKYRTDLNRLWDKLTRECRRIEPHRIAAIKLAKTIWRQQGLPPDKLI